MPIIGYHALKGRKPYIGRMPLIGYHALKGRKTYIGRMPLIGTMPLTDDAFNRQHAFNG